MGHPQTDGELLGAFAARRDEAAFEELVRRHETLVLNACRRVLGDAQDARDAAQAVFLTLALKAGRIDGSRPLGPWLHHVAACVAVNARKSREARLARERNVSGRAREPHDEALDALRPLLDRELDRLPEKYRRSIILFHLEGRSLEETAAELRRNVGTVGSWLSRGREMLRDRLARRGITALSTGLVTAFLAREASAHAVGLGFARSTARAATGGIVSEKAASMTEGAMKMLSLEKIRAVVLAASAAGFVVLANVIVLLGNGTPAARTASASAAPEALPAFEPPAPAPALEEQEPAPAKSSDLVAHWKLDDKEGAAVADASGRGHAGKVVGEVGRSDGKSGGALMFDGKGGHVELPNSKDLDGVQEGSYSLSAWFKPQDLPPGKESDNNATYGIVIKTGWHEGLAFSNEGKFIMTHWLQGKSDDEPQWTGAGTWEATYEPGKWYHVVGVVDHGAGQVQIYVNGEHVNTAEWTPNAAPRKFESSTWKIGIGSPGAENWSWPAKGSVDDVRIYNRPLSPADVKSLFEGK
jgi:RNA polymerase sigma factor (sigma-70 family)